MNTKERDCYSVAEEEAARAICRAIGGALGKDFFIGHNAGSSLCATFQLDEVPRELGLQFACAGQLNNVGIHASLRVTCARRGDVARILSSLLAFSPYIDEPGEALQYLRIRDDGFPAIEPATFADSQAWSVEIGFLVSFRIR